MNKYCEETVLNVEKSFWQKLNFWTNFRLRFHLWYCKNCADYKKDSTVLHRLLCGIHSKENHVHLTENEKEQLKKRLEY
jgi:hypothetical protein